jgi:hypothetical protein
VEGAAGTGKSRLLDEIARTLGQQGSSSVLRFECRASDSELHLVAATRLLRSVAATPRRRAQLVPTDDAATLFAQLASAFDRAGSTVLLVDDVHLADAASARLLESLAAPGGASSLWVVTTRLLAPPAASAPAPPNVRLAALTAQDLLPLGIEGAWEETAGHPRTLADCLDAARRGGALSADAVMALRSRAAAGGELMERVLQAAASLPPPIDAVRVAMEAGLPGAVVVDQLERALDLGLLRRRPPRRLVFAGDVVRRSMASPG